MGISDHSTVLYLLNLSRPPSGLRSPCSCPPPHDQVVLVRTKAWEQWNEADWFVFSWLSMLQGERLNADGKAGSKDWENLIFTLVQWIETRRTPKVSSFTFHAPLSLGLFVIASAPVFHPISIPKDILIFSEYFIWVAAAECLIQNCIWT